MALGALLVLRMWRYPGPYPGAGSQLLAEQVGAWPRLSPQAPFWHLLVRGLAEGAGEAAHARAQWVGHVALAVAVAMMYRVVLRFVQGSLDDDASPRWSTGVSRLAAAGSAAFLLACPPVWRAAQSPHPAVLGLCVAVLVSTVALGSGATNRTLWEYVPWAFLAGVGVVESPLAMVLLPLWVALLLLLRPFGFLKGPAADMMDEDASDDVGAWCLAAAAFVVGVAIGLLVAVVPFIGTEGFLLRGFSHSYQVLAFFARDYLRDLLGALPTVGWLVFVLGVVIPWLLVMGLARRVQNGEFGPGLAFLYAVAAVAVTVQATGPAPLQLWSLPSGDLFRVGACAISAMTFGLVAATWFLMADRLVRGLRSPAETSIPDRAPGEVFQRGAMGACCAFVGIAMIAAVLHALPRREESADRAAIRAVSRFAHRIVEDAGDCQWVVTDGMLDTDIRLAAWQAGSRLQPLCILPGQDAWTRRSSGRGLPDEESRSLFAISTQALLRDWIATRPEFAAKTAVQLGADLWAGSRQRLVPRGTVLRAVPVEAPADDAAELLASHKALWAEWRGLSADASGCAKEELAPRLAAVGYQLSRVANELGVLLEDAGAPVLATQAYAAGRDACPENLSVRINLLALRKRSPAPAPQPDALASEVGNLVRDKREVGLLSVVRAHGTIRDPSVIARLGLEKARMLPFADSAASFRPAFDLVPDASRDAELMRAAFANAHLAAGDVEGARTAYLAILARTPEDPAALLGLSLVEAKRSGLETALPLVDRARAARVAPTVCAVFEAYLRLEAGDAAGSRATLHPIIQQRPKTAAVWHLWGLSAIGLQDAEAYDQAQQELARLPGTRGISALLAAHAAELANDERGAARHMQRASSESPSDLRLSEATLDLLSRTGDLAAALPLAERILAVDPAHALARHVIGTLRLTSGDAVQAEVHLARAAATRPTGETLNNLAWARLQLGKLEQARRDVEAATLASPGNGEAWDTMAAVELALAAPETALIAARKAMDLRGESVATWLRVAEAASACGDSAAAQTSILAVEARGIDTLSKDERQRLERLRPTNVP